MTQTTKERRHEIRALGANQFEHIPLVTYPTSFQGSREVAQEIASLIRSKAEFGEHCVLGLATGSSPVNVYHELVKMHRNDGLSFENVVTFNLDEYFPMNPDELQSYVRFMHELLFRHVNIKPENIHIPDGTVPAEELDEYCRNYESRIASFGGLDLQLLGIGRTGHIGFNEPGSTERSLTRLVTLDHMTRVDAASDFFGEEFVPRKAITMGVGSIMRAKRIILLAWGEDKAKIVKAAVEGDISSKVPATILQTHENTIFVLDTAAASELKRSQEPWLFESVKWDEKLSRKAVLNLCTKVGKPILKLTDRDYNDHGLGDLINDYGTAYELNIAVFNQLQHTITGWPGGKPDAPDDQRPERANPAKKRVLIFSPHPDDDVISMGGTLIRLVDQEHEVHVAYQTSGNIAVFDEDVIAYADFVNDYHAAFGFEKEKSANLFASIKEEIKHKKAGSVDSTEVRRIKGLIRMEEAKAACRYVNVPDENVHFLNMPFYETGRIKKDEIGANDIGIIKKLITEVKPHQIYAAGDLSDPHGTHRVCLNAIFQVIDVLKSESWMHECWVWLYKGAWQEWDIEDIDMAVPLSPDELMRKRRAIFKHQSQKDRPLFPGSDTREFWQRAEDRNRGTARSYDQLGMADYEAIEAFRRYHF